jgi:HlyD family secretion protein
MEKKRIEIIILIVLALGISIFLYHKVIEQKYRLTLYGNVDIRDVELGFRVSGRVQELKLEEGDRVHKGQVMAELDKIPFEQDLTLFKAEMAEAQAKLSNAEKIYQRKTGLIKTGAVSQQGLDDALSARDEAQAMVAVAQANVDKAQTRLEDASILAPNNGTVLTRVRENGAIVAAGAVVYTLALDNPVWVRTYVDESSLGLIYPGQTAIVITDSKGHYKGKVGFISPQAEFTPKNVETNQLRTDLVYRLRVIIDQADNGLRQGMPVTVKLRK